MLGAIVGDVIGSVYERRAVKYKGFSLLSNGSTFTDDSVLTVAVAKAILSEGSYLDAIRQIGRRYPRAGYGGRFLEWLHASDPVPYNSWGNGSAMRVSPVAWAFDDEETVLKEAAATAMITHNHPEGIKGAQAVALAVYLARMGASKSTIKDRVSTDFGYDLTRTMDEIRPDYRFDVSCQGSVPEAIIAFLESTDFIDAIRNAVSLGGDADTQASIAGAIAEAFYGGVPSEIADEIRRRLPKDLLAIADRFISSYCPQPPPRNAYEFLIHHAALDRAERYRRQLGKVTSPGARLAAVLGSESVDAMSTESFLQALVDTKLPTIFAESAVRGDGSDWTLEELRILGDLSVSVPVTIFDDGRHSGPSVHNPAFPGTLLFVPGALLRGAAIDWDEVVTDGELNPEGYFRLYERRLLPVLLHADRLAQQRGKRAVVTVPGLGCGQFAGRFGGRLGQLLDQAIRCILTENAESLQSLALVYFDPYNECDNTEACFGSTQYRVRPLRRGSAKRPQLCRPIAYEEGRDDFSDCDLYSVVAWDHVSWPGNDYYAGSRSTDDGVKAAATDVMFALTGTEGQYRSSYTRYEHPRDYCNWHDVVTANNRRLKLSDNLVVYG